MVFLALKNPCIQAIEVRVCGVRPVDKDISWHSQVNEFVHEKLYQKVNTAFFVESKSLDGDSNT